MIKIGFKRSITLKEALLWVIFAGFCAHMSLWILNKSADAFYESSVSKLTGSRIEILQKDLLE